MILNKALALFVWVALRAIYSSPCRPIFSLKTEWLFASCRIYNFVRSPHKADSKNKLRNIHLYESAIKTALLQARSLKRKFPLMKYRRMRSLIRPAPPMRVYRSVWSCTVALILTG